MKTAACNDILELIGNCLQGKTNFQTLIEQGYNVQSGMPPENPNYAVASIKVTDPKTKKNFACTFLVREL